MSCFVLLFLRFVCVFYLESSDLVVFCGVFHFLMKCYLFCLKLEFDCSVSCFLRYACSI